MKTTLEKVARESDAIDYRAMLAREKATGAHAYGIWFVRGEIRRNETYRETVERLRGEPLA